MTPSVARCSSHQGQALRVAAEGRPALTGTCAPREQAAHGRDEGTGTGRTKERCRELVRLMRTIVELRRRHAQSFGSTGGILPPRPVAMAGRRAQRRSRPAAGLGGRRRLGLEAREHDGTLEKPGIRIS